MQVPLCLLVCCQVREEAGELCQTLEANEGKERAASEMADLLYHAMVLLNVQVGGARTCELRVQVIYVCLLQMCSSRDKWLALGATIAEEGAQGQQVVLQQCCPPSLSSCF